MKIKIALLALSLVSFSALADEGKPVVRTERTGNERIMVVGQCGVLSNQDVNGNIRLGYQLPLTKCVQYRTFNAIKTGSGWNATYTPTSVAVLSGKMEMSTQEFANTYSVQDEMDRILANAALLSQCLGSKNQFQALASTEACI